MSESQKREVNESMVISIMILHGDYMSQELNILYIYIHTHTHLYDNGHICYLLSATYMMKCNCFVFELEIIHCACGCPTPPFISFFRRCKCYW